MACPFSDCGCDFRGFRTMIAQHMKDSPGIHLNMAGKMITIQKRLLALYDERVTEQNKWIELLGKKVNGLEKSYGPQYIWKIDHYQVRIKTKFEHVDQSLFLHLFFSFIRNVCKKLEITNERLYSVHSS